MATFRFHVVTVMGIFFALALGIFIGSTFTEGYYPPAGNH